MEIEVKRKGNNLNKGAENMKELIQITVNNKGQRAVSARELHKGLKINSNFTTWFKRMCEYGFEEGIDYIILWSDSKNGNAVQFNGNPQSMSAKGYEKDYIITLDMAKEIAMIQRTEIGRQFRQYFIKCEEMLRTVAFRLGDKKHQLECMEFLQDILPEEFKKEQVSYIKANTVVNKVVSNIYGFPRMLKKKEMNFEMLETREQVLEDYLKLFEVLEDNHEVKMALYRKYDKKTLKGVE